MAAHTHALLGRAIADGAAGRAKRLVRRRDDGKVFDGEVEQALSTKFSKEEEQVLEYTGKRVVDLRCGAGRLLKKLSERSKELCGLDVSPEAVETCRRAGFEARVGDLVDTSFEGRFDSVLLFNSQIGIGGSAEGTKRLLETIGSFLRPGGAIVGTYIDRTEAEAAEDKAYYARLKSLGRAPGQAAFRYEYGSEVGEPFLLWCPTLDELTSVTTECGYGIDFVQLAPGTHECYAVITRS
jgi:SAM-dependent methyltransferase